MSPIKFETQQASGFYEYHLKSNLNDFFNISLFPLSQKLNTATLDDWSSYLWKKGITYYASQENSILYTLLLDFFRQDYNTQVISTGTENDFSYLNKVPEKCHWKYALEFTTDDSNLCRDFEFLSRIEFYKTVNYSNQKIANYYQISDFEKEYTSQFIKMYHSDVSNWSFIYSNQPLKIKQLLSDKHIRPTKKTFFELADILINIQIGGDEGYLDYIQIIARENLDSNISIITKKLNLFIKNYEALLFQLGEIDNEIKIDQFKENFKIILQL